MADKIISDFTEVTSIDASDWLEIENTGGNSRKVKASVVSRLFLIESFTFTGSQSSKTFSSIPATFKDLILVFHGRSDRAGQATSQLGIRFNGDSTAANYHTQNINASGATVNASAQAGTVGYGGRILLPAATSTAGFSGQARAEIARYAGTTFHKSMLVDCFWAEATSTQTEVRSGARWLSTSAITSLELLDVNSANLTSGSTVELYGRA